jgi:hypothetical protein
VGAEVDWCGSGGTDLKHGIAIAGGAADITVAAQPKRRGARRDIAIVGPNEPHACQLRAGAFDIRHRERGW